MRLDVTAIRHGGGAPNASGELESIPAADREIRSGDTLFIVGRENDIAKIKE